jgi:hypothetical protein
MTQASSQQVTQTVNQLWKFRSALLISLGAIHLVGYGLIVLSILDLLALPVPPQFFNPQWEFQIMGQVVERVPVTLLGFALLFMGGKDNRPQWEQGLLKVTSWLLLLLSVVYLLMVPLSTRNLLRLNRQSALISVNRIEQVVSQVDPVREQLETITTPEQLAAFLSQQSGQVVSTQQVSQLPQSVTEIRDQSIQALNEQEATSIEQINQERSSQRLRLFKSGGKWNVGSLVSAGIFFLIWKTTPWARQ